LSWFLPGRRQLLFVSIGPRLYAMPPCPPPPPPLRVTLPFPGPSFFAIFTPVYCPPPPKFLSFSLLLFRVLQTMPLLRHFALSFPLFFFLRPLGSRRFSRRWFRFFSICGFLNRGPRFERRFFPFSPPTIRRVVQTSLRSMTALGFFPDQGYSGGSLEPPLIFHPFFSYCFNRV